MKSKQPATNPSTLVDSTNSATGKSNVIPLSDPICPRRRTLEEMLQSTFANMALEGYELTADEKIEVWKRAQDELAPRLRK